MVEKRPHGPHVLRIELRASGAAVYEKHAQIMVGQQQHAIVELGERRSPVMPDHPLSVIAIVDETIVDSKEPRARIASDGRRPSPRPAVALTGTQDVSTHVLFHWLVAKGG